MTDGDDLVQFVLASSVRADVLSAVAEGTHTTDDLLASLDASSSAVYNAIGRLEDASLLAVGDDGWTVTGSGRLVADCVGLQQRLDTLLSESGGYLATHDAGVLPVEYRFRMSDLAGGTVLEATETEPQRVVREVADRLERAPRARMIAPIYIEAYAGSMPLEPESRLLLDRGVLETIAETAGDGDGGDADVRIADVDFSMAVTDADLLLSLPTLDGRYDPQSEFVAGHDRALRWGRNLFDALWQEAVPVGE